MINCKDFYNVLAENGIRFFTGVPDSLLKDFCAYVTDHTDSRSNIIAANEGNAVAIAAGRYLASGEIGLVYMQNSGLGNAVNPLTSLTDPLVYGIPVMLLVGWRGEPGKKDEPQHAKQGEITTKLLTTLGIKYAVLPDSLPETEGVITDAVDFMRSQHQPFALVVPKGRFAGYTLQTKVETSFELSREDAINLVVSAAAPDSVFVSTTGKTSRELFECRDAAGQGHERDFLTVGSMGHSSQIALGIALSKPEIDVYCLDGDGALIMHMGALAIIGDQSPANYKHIIFNNGAHDSVGGQPTTGFNIDISAVAEANGYNAVYSVSTQAEVLEKLQQMQTQEGPALLEIKVNKGSRKDLGRPTTSPAENKQAFMRFLAQN